MKKALQQGFSTFLRRRRAKQHFERRPLLESLTAAPSAAASAGGAAPAVLAQGLLAAAGEEPAQALARLQSSTGGLDAAEAARRLARDGPNEIAHEAPLPGWLRLWRCYVNPFNLLLTALALLSFFSADGKATAVIGALVALSTVIRFVQEGRSHRAAHGLRTLVTNTASVIRGGLAGQAAQPQELAVRDLVAGDVVALSAGDMIPADCRVLSARDLFVAQAAMTGESLPVEKFVHGSSAPGSAALDQPNLLFMGTNVVSGTATALVLATGPRSCFGTLAAHATVTETAPNAFQAGVNSVSWLLIRFAAVMVPIVFFVNGFTKGDWLEAFLFALSVAVKTLPPSQTSYSVADEAGLKLIGYIAFLDPPKESAAPALQQLAGHGIAVKVLTGDNELVTRQVCRQVGLPADAVMLGAQVEALSDAALQAAAASHSVFAKLTPLHKERIVRALRASGHVVGFMGDGINDAPALRAADIGISVDSAVDIAKEAADIILLEKSLRVLDDGVVEGRTTFCNMLKYIRMTASSNFGNVLSVLVASAFLPFLPMLPLQLLVQNLLYDIGQTGIPFDNVDPELVTRPLKWNPSDIGRFMLFFGPISSLFDIITFAVMWWVFDANSLAHQTLFQSGWFVVGLLTQTLVVHMLRTPKLPFVQSHAAAPLLATTLVIMALGLWLPNGPLASELRLQALPPAYCGWLLAILLGYCGLTTLMKRVYTRRFGWQ